MDKNFLKNNFDSILRDINLSILMSEMVLPFPSIKRVKMGNNYIFNKKHWSIIKTHKDDAIISGSLSLIAFGLIDRDPNDIDIILLDKDHNMKLSKDRYGDQDIPENLGYYIKGDTYVDVFKRTNKTRYFECEGYKIDHPLDVLSRKAGFLKNSSDRNHKDFKDIAESLEKLNFHVGDKKI